MLMKVMIALALSAWSVLTQMDSHAWDSPQQPSIRQRDNGLERNSALSCNLSHAQMPQASPPLPAPQPGLSLALVAIGRGVQNYTCHNASATPVSIGAVASLYNVSCVAASNSALLSRLPNLALQKPVTAVLSILPPDVDLSGHHFFSNPTTPVFDLDVGTVHLGVVVAKKVASSPAPPSAPSSDRAGNVPWLYLETLVGTMGSIKAVYRLNTAGGQAPSTCENSPAQLSVQYAAEYWFWSS